MTGEQKVQKQPAAKRIELETLNNEVWDSQDNE